MKLRYIASLSIIMLAPTVQSVYAKDIEITPEHDCVYQQEYDDDSHWGVCKICNAQSEDVGHNLNVTYRYGDNTCSVGNVKYLNCLDCGYKKTVGEDNIDNKPEHEPLYAEFDGGKVRVTCKNCYKPYQYSWDSYPPFLMEDGTELKIKLGESSQLRDKMPCYLFDMYGNKVYVDKEYYSIGTDTGLIDATVNLDNNGYITITGTINDVTDDPMYKDVRATFYVVGAVDGFGTQEAVKITPYRLERIGDTFEFSLKFKARDPKSDVYESSYLRVLLDSVYDNDLSYECVYRMIGGCGISLNKEYPIIDLAECGVR